MVWPKKIHISEVGPRDGLQIEKTILSVAQKASIINHLVLAGAEEIEIGSFVNLKAVPQMADTEKVFAAIDKKDNITYRVLVFNLQGIKRAAAAGVKFVQLAHSASISHSIKNLNKTPSQMIQELPVIFDYATAHDIVLSGAISTAFGCAIEGKVDIEQVFKIILSFYSLGVLDISLSDTSGMAVPRQVYEYCLKVKERFPAIRLGLHFHNTRGTGLANVIAGMQAGVDRFDSSIAGLGGCPFAPGASGNVATEDLVHMSQEMNIETGFDLPLLISIGKEIQKIVGHDTESFLIKAGMPYAANP
ncbi:MAG: hydroxymethylglutaryl-CoA lyase [Spirochaetia bacterium]|jgi:hydroxymethylglutaryl-CoA lyase|nr:hydroxymethylglutaryl-CoA lyase [Spirochaetia bacterium]